jgi:UDP-N-acetylmuramoyl-tripeptide--D-alanyl-D-alanine ligase
VACVIVHREPAAEVLARAQARDVAIVLVDNTVLALNRLAAAYRAGEYSGGMRAKVIAVGGSNGKTTTKRIIHALLAEKFAKGDGGGSGGGGGGHVSPKSFNNNIGMPLTLLEVSPSHEYVVLEIGTNAPGEIAALGEVCRPDIAVIASIGLEHLEKLGDLEGVAREEASVAPFVAEGGTLVLPADAPELLKAVKTKVQRILIGQEGQGAKHTGLPADLVLTGVRESLHGTMFSINGRGQFRVPLLGEHNAMNALMAIAVARRMGVSDEQIAAGLMKVTAAEGRFEPLKIAMDGGDLRVIHDAYNANPSSMEAALKTFMGLERTERTGRKVAVLGDMLELGASSQAMHRSIGEIVARLGFDLFVAIGPNMRYAADAAAMGGVTTRSFSGTAAARKEIGGLLESGDSILLKGSRGMALETLLEALRHSMMLEGAVSRAAD